MNDLINELCEAGGGRYRSVTIGESAQALLDIQDQHCWLSGGESTQETLAALSASLPVVAEVDEITAKQWPRQQGMPLSQFFWWAGLQFSQNEIMRGLKPFPKFRLVNWPDFSWMMHTKSHLDMTRILIKQPASLQEISTNIGVAETTVIAFINACYLCGWVKGKMTADHASQIWQSSEQPEDLPDVISKIRTSLEM